MLTSDLEKLLDHLAPFALAEPWDNVGLLVGDPEADLTRVLVALDFTSEVLEEAISGGFDAVVTHHPAIFSPLRRLTAKDRLGRDLLRLASARVALFACHTNLDAAPDGLCELLARRLRLEDLRPLVRAGTGWKKLVGFVPPGALEAVSSAVFAAGAGVIGEYQNCAFYAPGTGTFTPGSSAQPYLGMAGKFEQAEELRWETVVPAGRIAAAVEAFVGTHPYEEPAFDVYPLEDVTPRAGQGRVGSLRSEVRLDALAETVSEILGLGETRFSGDPQAAIQTVAVVTGSGGSLLEAAAVTAQVLITGDLRYHDAERALDLGLTLIQAPHDAVEHWALSRWVEKLNEALADHNAAARFSSAWRSPWRSTRGEAPAESPAPLAVESPDSCALASQPELDLPARTYRLFVDGGARGNPGPAALGVVLENEEGQVVEEIAEAIGHATNNVAEYQALVTGLETALDRGVRRLRVLSDSELLVRQVLGQYKVKNERLRELYLRVRDLISEFESVEIRHISRDQNATADGLVNQALDSLA